MIVMEYKLQTLWRVIGILIFLGSCALVVIGQKSISYQGLGLMGLGLAGAIGCLWFYNRKHR